ncbi:MULTISPECIES: zinc-dependent metalloprotease [Butyricimonas]|uniref:zinc-dependent metalloprotease n=1 Tax=Butyricimonas TaxID=574697 RepID=UPI001D061ABE|nr:MULTISPECIES: zinc-dependent metalloprotease [Butyricimonas]MCB6972654.1 zinc-dependent metalloprotease [Butyricimonas synergistica]MCG4519662.1 zinc-dependent metalloprotease [Butyricimonas sp. DFI.6.44]
MKNCMYALLVILILLPGYGKLFASNEVKSGYGCLYDTLTKDSTKETEVRRKLKEVMDKKKSNRKEGAESDTLVNDSAKMAQEEAKRKLKEFSEKRKTAYDRLFADKAFETSESDFITLHKIDKKLYFEMPLEYFGREMVLSSAASETSNSVFADMAHRTMMHVKFKLVDSLVYLQRVNTTTTYDAKEKNIKSAIEANSLDVVVEAFKISAFKPDQTTVVFEVTKFFTEENEYLPLFRGSYSVFNILPKMKFGASVVSSIKTFDDNLTVKVLMPYTVSLTYLMSTYARADVTVVATRSLMLLPEDKMRPRKSDLRVGIFLTDKEHFTQAEDRLVTYSVAHRWRVEPKDVNAYKQGKLVEPKKPIVWYVDTAFPKEWIEPVKKGILRWNKAFEKIGFKNVMQVRDFPKNDTIFDPDNLKYSCVRYLPTSIANAMGPSYVDPTTGEIISASVLVYSNMVQMINNWRFVQTAQIDPLVRNKKMPKKIMDESIEYVVAHEIGHTLGFMHNMAASAAIPVESLRSAEYTKKYGTTPSIMDYARFNYVAQPGDKGVSLTPPDLGVYDEYLVKWNYEYFPTAKSMNEEAVILEKMVDAKAGDPMYRYGRQQVYSRYDPSALEEDLGDDPMKAGEYGIKNLKYILSNLDSWIKDDPDDSHKLSLYQGICNQYYRYIRNVMYNIGGIYLSEVKEGTPGERVVSVPREKQKASMKWVMNEFRNSDWVCDKKLISKFPLGIDMGVMIQKSLALSLHQLYKGVMLSAHVATDPYTVEEFFDDYYNLVFENTINGKPLTEGDKMLQMAAVNMVAETFKDKQSGGLFGVVNAQDAYRPSLEDVLAYGLDESGLTNKFAGELRREECQDMPETIKFGSGYGWQRQISMLAIDNSDIHIYTLGKRIQRLLESKVSTSQGAELMHYEALLFMLERRLKK